MLDGWGGYEAEFGGAGKSGFALADLGWWVWL